MAGFILRRLGVLLLTLFIASVIIFALLEVIPGDPALTMLGINATPETLTVLRDELGLNANALSRYLAWMGGMLTGDFGLSYTYRTPVAELLAHRMAITLPLAIYALFFTVMIALPFGFLAGARAGKWGDRVILFLSQIGIALPNFWFALLLIFVFAIQLGWVSAGGFSGWDKGLWQGLAELTLPAIALAIPQATILLRVLRSGLIEITHQDYIRTARAKGLSRDQALWRHGWRNALIPVVTIMGMQFSFLIAGAIIIENVFTLPGLGRLMVQAIGQRDIILVEAIILMMVLIVITVTFITDVIYALIDPRLRRPKP
ncbi:MAG TPA: peptide ABC transporter [Alphaproteobacteria bacterium]|nr:peptide ABC transporter [Alphaproteobacteria bacterium]